MVISKGVSLYEGISLAVFTTGWNIIMLTVWTPVECFTTGEREITIGSTKLAEISINFEIVLCKNPFHPIWMTNFSCGYIDRYWLVQSSGSHVELELQHFKVPGSSLQTFHLAPDGSIHVHGYWHSTQPPQSRKATYLGSREGAVVRVLVSHRCHSGSVPNLHVGVTCRLSMLLVLYSAPRGFPPETLVFPSPQKLIFPNSDSILECTDISERVLVNSLVLHG